MDKLIKAKWLAALRSGEYKQIKDKLHTTSGHCCLGVLTEVVEGKDCWSTDSFGRIALNGETSSLTFGTREKAEFPTHIDGKSVSNTLITMNDSGGKSFAEIADWVEENL